MIARTIKIAFAFALFVILAAAMATPVRAYDHHGRHDHHRWHHGGVYVAPAPVNNYYVPPANYYTAPEPSYYYTPAPPPSEGINLFFGIH
jgi:hypothetical protein